LQVDRLDRALVARGLAPTRSAAQSWIRAGSVTVDGRVETRVSRSVQPSNAIGVTSTPPFVGRGGEKLAAALDAFAVDPLGRVCADVGSSTGGFTDCLLARGAARVHAVDVGRDQLHARLRTDPRVVVREGTDARTLADLGERVRLAVVDVAFVSARLVLPSVRGWLDADADAIVLVKPQFEAGPGAVGRDGVVRDRSAHERALCGVLATLVDLGLMPQGLVPSPIRGGTGNAEFLVWARLGAEPKRDLDAALASALDAVHAGTRARP
jgi:23S rRNA (cytidine1920-2'-O)/16S rRNA (cytidine1409-2'-O)-methyltransferase